MQIDVRKIIQNTHSDNKLTISGTADIVIQSSKPTIFYLHWKIYELKVVYICSKRLL